MVIHAQTSDATYCEAQRARPLWDKGWPDAPAEHTEAIDEAIAACAAARDNPAPDNLLRVEWSRGFVVRAIRAAFEHSFAPSGIAVRPVCAWMSAGAAVLRAVDTLVPPNS